MTSRGMQIKSHLLIIINCVLITSKFCQIFQYLRKLNRFKMKMKGEKKGKKKSLKQSNRLITCFRAMLLITYIYKEVLLIWISGSPKHTDLYESDRCKGYLRLSVSTAWLNHQVPGKVMCSYIYSNSNFNQSHC